MDERPSENGEFPKPDVQAVVPASVDAAGEPPETGAASVSFLGLFLGMPMLIVGTIIGGAVLTVALFGAPSSPQERNLEDLLQAIEASDGGRSMGMLLPASKEHWQTGLELTERLRRKESEFSDEDLSNIAARIGKMILLELARRETATSGQHPDISGRQAKPNRLAFLVRALGLTGRPEAADVLLAVVRSGDEVHATTAMEQLGNLRTFPGLDRAIVAIVNVLETARRAETRLVACTVLSVVATPEEADARVLDALESARLSEDGEVEWAAALALARLGSAEGKSTLMDLLDRSFWETGDRYRIKDDTGRERRYPMPPGRIEELLIGAIEAAAGLDESDLWEMIEQLAVDPSPAVRAKAAIALPART